MKRITICRVCKSKKIKEFLDLGHQPYANALLKSPNDKDKFYPLSLSYCENCSLVQLNHTPDPKELFSNYIWVTSTSSVAKKHAKVFCNDIVERIENKKKDYILEIASNDGTFLLPFIKKGYKVLGVDPAQNIVDMAIKNGIPTKCEFFGVTAAKKIKKDFGTSSIIIARNVLPHVANAHDLIKGISICLADNGLFVLELHYAKKIFQELHYDSVYHEHLCYFTIKSLEKLLTMEGLFIQDLKISPINAGNLVIYIKKGKVNESATVKAYRKAEKEIKLNTFKSWVNFANRTKNHREQLLKILNKYKGALIVGYGASARSSTLLNYCDIGIKYISTIADQNPLKQGLYTAGTHIQIKSPDEVMKKNPDFVVILAWNFKTEIMKILKDRYKYKGKFILPLPNNPKVI
ncbi:MAG: class I SAM-dependent methyltransferase [Candidatus Parcubacteria bacterium]|nr:class I SAM-dependent methyltransferase [Candidatus Parcubacteria bacterium]